mmetsp:Transcript_4502/g.6810  ORF Transcript_4502/g.6810 Transcript_4502/m.6810 type:complete len:116 (-) Transcript_4502:40-387(-)
MQQLGTGILVTCSFFNSCLRHDPVLCRAIGTDFHRYFASHKTTSLIIDFHNKSRISSHNTFIILQRLIASRQILSFPRHAISVGNANFVAIGQTKCSNISLSCYCAATIIDSVTR